jgi:hypothetical protein
MFCHRPYLRNTKFIYFNPPAPREEPVQAPEAAEDMTIEKVGAYCKKILTIAEKLISKVKEYYRANGVPMDNRILDAYKKVTASSLELTRHLKTFEGKKLVSSLDEKEQQVIRGTLSGLRNTISSIASSSTRYLQGESGDPMDAKLGPVGEKAQTFNADLNRYLAQLDSTEPFKEDAGTEQEPTPKEKESPVKKKEEARQSERPEKPKTASEELLLTNVNNVVGLILQAQMEGKPPRELTKEEQRAVMLFINPKETRKFRYVNGSQVTELTLERDWTGYYLRILNLKTGNPFVAVWKRDVPPKWGTVTESDLETVRISSRQRNLQNKLDWLALKSTPPGSRLFVKKATSGAEVIKQADGQFRVITTFEGGGNKPSASKSKILSDISFVADALGSMIDDKTTVETQSASDAEKLAEEKSKTAAENADIQKKLVGYSQSLIQSYIFGKETALFKRYFGEIQKFVSAKNITEWLSPLNTGVGDHRVRIHDGRIAIIIKIDSPDSTGRQNRYRIVSSWGIEGEGGKTRTA